MRIVFHPVLTSDKIEVNWSERGRVRVCTGGTRGVTAWKFPQPAKFVEVQYVLGTQYRARYLNSRGEQETWSQTDGAMVSLIELQLSSSQAA